MMTNYLFNEWVFMKSAYQLALTTCKDFMKEYISKNEQLGIGQGVVMKGGWKSLRWKLFKTCWQWEIINDGRTLLLLNNPKKTFSILDLCTLEEIDEDIFQHEDLELNNLAQIYENEFNN